MFFLRDWKLQSALASVLLFSTPTYASFSEDMDDFWNQSKSASISRHGPITNQTQESTTYSFGSFHARVPARDITLFHVTPPSIKTGCNGIDMNLGAFSMISSSEFKDMLAKTMQGVPYYAFSVAMNAMCPTCNQTMQKLASEANKAAAFAKDSCYAAQQIVQRSGAEDWIRENVKKGKIAVGLAEDAGSTQNSGVNPEKDTTVQALLNEAVNLTYYALVTNKTAQMFGTSLTPSDIKLTREILISMTGTVIASFEGVSHGDNPSDVISDPKIQMNYFGASFSPDTLVDGVKSDEEIEIFECDSDAPETEPKGCLKGKPVVKDGVEIPSFQEKVKELIVSIRDKLGQRGPASVLSEGEKQFIAIDPLGTYNFMIAMKKNGHYLSYDIEEDASKLIARELAYRISINILKNMRTAIGNTNRVPLTEKTDILKQIDDKIDLYTKVKTEINQEIDQKRVVLMTAMEMNSTTGQ